MNKNFENLANLIETGLMESLALPDYIEDTETISHYSVWYPEYQLGQIVAYCNILSVGGTAQRWADAIMQYQSNSKNFIRLKKTFPELNRIEFDNHLSQIEQGNTDYEIDTTNWPESLLNLNEATINSKEEVRIWANQLHKDITNQLISLNSMKIDNRPENDGHDLSI